MKENPANYGQEINFQILVKVSSKQHSQKWWRRRELNSLPKPSALQFPRASPLYFISTPSSAGAAWKVVQLD